MMLVEKEGPSLTLAPHSAVLGGLVLSLEQPWAHSQHYCGWLLDHWNVCDNALLLEQIMEIKDVAKGRTQRCCNWGLGLAYQPQNIECMTTTTYHRMRLRRCLKHDLFIDLAEKKDRSDVSIQTAP